MNLTHHILADFFLPKNASNLGVDIDNAWNIILWTTGVFFCIVVGSMTFFIFKYKRRTPNDVTSKITHNTPLEIAWTTIPLIIVLAFFYVGFKGFLNYDTPSSSCVNVYVTGQKWKFSFAYPNGATSENLYLLVGQDVKLNMTSKDVLHALYIPVFRTQRNLIPYRQTVIWFKPTEVSPSETGDASDMWRIYCTQFCGNGHSKMTAHVYVLAQKEYDEKMIELANPFRKKMPNGELRYIPYYQVGEKLYKEVGCSSCHSVDEKETIGTGPPWHGLYTRNHEFSYTNVPGYTLTANDPSEKWEEYLKESMLQPDNKLVSFGGKAMHGMPSFSTQLSGSESNVEKQRALSEYIKSLGTKPYEKPDEKTAAYDAAKNKEHPESLAAKKAATQSQPATTAGQ